MRGLKKSMAKEQLHSCTFMALANNLLLFSKCELGLLSTGRQILRNVSQAQICLFFQMNSFPLYVFWHHPLYNFLSSYFTSRNIFSSAFLMPLRMLSALVIYKTPTVTQYLEMWLHLTACQNNKSFEVILHFWFLGKWNIEICDHLLSTN